MYAYTCQRPSIIYTHTLHEQRVVSVRTVCVCVCVLVCQVLWSRDPDAVVRPDDVAPEAAAILMTSSPRRRAQQHRGCLDETSRPVATVVRRCSSCWRDATSRISEPEVEMSGGGSRDGAAMTSRRPRVWDRGVGGGASPAIEMSRQQVLRIYVLDSRAGSDVRDGHVIAQRRGCDAGFPAAAKSHHLQQQQQRVVVSPSLCSDATTVTSCGSVGSDAGWCDVTTTIPRRPAAARSEWSRQNAQCSSVRRCWCM